MYGSQNKGHFNKELVIDKVKLRFLGNEHWTLKLSEHESV